MKCTECIMNDTYLFSSHMSVSTHKEFGELDPMKNCPFGKALDWPHGRF